MNAESVPHLFAVTRTLASLRGVPHLDPPALGDVSELLSYADPHHPLVWIRGDRGCVGVGEVMRLEFRGEDRFADATRAWRRISEHATVDNPVRVPGTGLIAFGTFAFDDRSRSTSVLLVPRMVISRHDEQMWITEISTEPIAEDPKLPARRDPQQWGGAILDTLVPDEAYLEGVRRATALIEQGEAEKIVMARRVLGELHAEDDIRIPLGRLADRYTDCWTYAVDGMIGASPETLVRQTDGSITARVLAGTRGRRDAVAADHRERDELLGSAKEQHEHAYAVQSVITALAPHVQELRTSEQPFALELPNVWHLATDLEAVPSDGGSSLELTAALHPTAAVAGTPTRNAVEAITRVEPFDRERYAGAVGWVDADGDGEWVIALRCAQLGEPVGGVRTITAFAGGGIVAGSDPAHELRETVSKFRPIAEALAP